MSKETINAVKDKVASVPRLSLNQIIEDYTTIAHQLEEGEATDELIEQLEVTQADFAAKLYGMYYVIQMNEAKKDTFYKVEIEAYKGKISRLDKSTAYLKERCMLAIDVFGTNNKIVTEALNASKVTLKTVKIDEEVFNTRVNVIKDYICGLGETLINADEQEFLTCDVVIKGVRIDATKDLFVRINAHRHEALNITVDVKLKSKEVKERLVENEAFNQTVRIANPELFNTNPIEELTVDLLGVSLGENCYPRFS